MSRFCDSFFSLINKATPIMMVDLPNASMYIKRSPLGNMHQNSGHWQLSRVFQINTPPLVITGWKIHDRLVTE